jgi:D-galactose 1-dehydrogenase
MPPEPRYAVARDAFAAGLHVLSEKPPTPTVGEMLALIDHAHAHKRILFTTWHSQYNDGVDEAKRLLKGKTVKTLKVTWKEDVRHWHPGQEWIWQPGGFGVLDPGINAFSIVTKIMPQPIFVSECTLETPSNKQTPIGVQIRFKPSWSGDADLSAELDWRQTGEQTWDIHVVTADGLDILLQKGGTELSVNGQKTVARPSEEYEAIYQHFAELLESGQSYIDIAPLQLVSDCFMRGKRVETDAFL